MALRYIARLWGQAMVLTGVLQAVAGIYFGDAAVQRDAIIIFGVGLLLLGRR